MYAIRLLIFTLAFLFNGRRADASPIAARSGTSSEDITYILPIWEGSSASHKQGADLAVLSDMKTLLGLGGSHTKLGWSFSSWALSRDINNASFDYSFNPTNLNYMLNLTVESDLPMLVHMNNGRWADCCTPNSDGGWGDTLLDHISTQPNTTMIDSSGASQYHHNGGWNYFSISRLNTVYRAYKKRNIQASARVIASWALEHPTLFTGVSLSSETIFPDNTTDVGYYAVEEWKQWLQNSGIYGPGGQYFGAGRVPACPDIQSFNIATGQSFASWPALKPPSQVVPGDLFGEEWQRWRVMMIIHSVSDETLWIASAGIDRTFIFGHQTPGEDNYNNGDSVETETAANGGGGVTYYGKIPGDLGETDNPMRGAGKNNWGIFELNPKSTDLTTSYNSLLNLYNDGIKIICPNSWESDEAVKDQYAIFDSPDFGDAFGLAIKRFLVDYGNTPRRAQPPPWNPGPKVLDLYDMFSNASIVGRDNHLEASGSVGNVVRKSIQSQVPGTISYSALTLPAVSSGQRLNLWTSVGIKDGAGMGGDVQFQITINGVNLFGPGFELSKNYWVWKRWVPIMVDVTLWAGTTVNLQLLTKGNDVYGWAMWGSPAIYETATIDNTAAGNNLALGATVSVSSQDGIGSGWDATYLTDGNIDGGISGRNGWSSVSHASSLAAEWARVDLGGIHNIGKVVLFARSDLVDFSGTGFPTAFRIQGSTEGSTWSTLTTLTNYPNPKAGEGQIFTFVSCTARYVRVITTTLGGVGNEVGYRMQLTEMEVYA